MIRIGNVDQLFLHGMWSANIKDENPLSIWRRGGSWLASQGIQRRPQIGLPSGPWVLKPVL